jgi:2-polyprenyl-3-methyl-5-hydroxy-6-metoxy-1,4-benzoquinol methylase
MKKVNKFKPCPLCHKPTNLLLTEKIRRGSGEVYFCASCTHGFLISKDLKKDLKFYYDKEYRNEYSHKSIISKTNPKEIFDTYKKFQKIRLEQISPFLNKKTSLLEIGCSAGQFLYHIKNKVKVAHGIEVDSSCCDFLKVKHKIDCDNQYIQESKFKNSKYDVICAFQVLEHVFNPLDFINNILNVANEEATIFIEVPNLHDPLINIWNLENYNSFFYHKAHLHYFTNNSLGKLAQQAGLSKRQISFVYTQDYNLLNHLHWIMNDCPQDTCNIGLSEIKFSGKSDKINSFLNHEIKKINNKYIKILSDLKMTSNILMIIKLKKRSGL